MSHYVTLRIISIVILVIFFLTFAVAATVSIMEAVHDAYIEAHCAVGTGEGPDYDFTLKWYLFRALDAFDSVLRFCCKAIGREDLFFEWRIWLLEKYNITIY